MSHAEKADKLLIKPTAGARPASPCMPGRFIRKARDTRPDARRVTSSTDNTTLATAPDGPTNRLLQKPERPRQDAARARSLDAQPVVREMPVTGSRRGVARTARVACRADAKTPTVNLAALPGTRYTFARVSRGPRIVPPRKVRTGRPAEAKALPTALAE